MKLCAAPNGLAWIARTPAQEKLEMSANWKRLQSTFAGPDKNEEKLFQNKSSNMEMARPKAFEPLPPGSQSIFDRNHETLAFNEKH